MLNRFIRSSPNYDAAVYQITLSECFSDEAAKQYGKFHLKIPNLSHETRFFCYNMTNVKVSKVLYYSGSSSGDVMTKLVILIYSYPHDLVVLCDLDVRQR